MKEHLEQHILELSEHLIQLEQNAKLMKQKRAASSVVKFHISTGWLCKKLLASHVASPETGMRISKDKNRYVSGSYVPSGVTYDITIGGVLPLMEIDGFVREVRPFRFDHATGKSHWLVSPCGRASRLEHVIQTLPSQNIAMRQTAILTRPARH
jgi:hypothetical protein